MNLRLLNSLILIYGGLLLYASLMPFDFESGTHAMRGLQQFWNHWPITPQARISGSDVVSNLALYFPLGFLLATRFQINRYSLPLSLIAATLMCATLSLGVEIGQLFMISRISSASDWLFNFVSAILGAALGTVWGGKIWSQAVWWLRTLWLDHPLDIASLIILALLAADATTPFMPTILLKQVGHSLKISHFSLAQGLTEHPWHWWLVLRIFVFSALTLMLSAWGGHSPRLRSLGKAAALSALFILCLEIAKLMVVSRAFNIANVVTGWVGCLIAFPLGSTLTGKMSAPRKLELGLLGLLLLILYLAWTPFTFTWKPELIRNSLPSPIQLLPFYHYAMGATLNHARLFMQSFFLLALLIYLLRVRFGWFENSRAGIFRAVVLTATFGFLQEGGQLFLPERTPSMTDVYCFAIGGWLGAWISRPSSHTIGTYS